MEQELLRRTLFAAQQGPYRVKLRVVQDECVELPGHDGTFPVAVGVAIEQAKP
jgi:hypothetical protein